MLRKNRDLHGVFQMLISFNSLAVLFKRHALFFLYTHLCASFTRLKFNYLSSGLVFKKYNVTVLKYVQGGFSHCFGKLLVLHIGIHLKDFNFRFQIFTKIFSEDLILIRVISWVARDIY